MRFSMELASMAEGDYRNILRVHEHEGWVYIEIEAKHDGVKVCSTVKVDRQVFAYHLRASGVLS